MKKFISALVPFLPSVAFAQTITDVNTLSYKITNLGNLVIEFLIGFAVIFIIYNVVRFITTSGEGRGEYRTSILWGIVGLFVILSIWGLVRILTNTFRTDTNAPVNQYPRVQYPTNIP